jgi:geranylgeranyl diphosphate synthase type II
LYEKLEVRYVAEQQIELRFERALSILNTLSIDEARTATLREFARNLMGRKK